MLLTELIESGNVPEHVQKWLQEYNHDLMRTQLGFYMATNAPYDLSALTNIKNYERLVEYFDCVSILDYDLNNGRKDSVGLIMVNTEEEWEPGDIVTVCPYPFKYHYKARVTQNEEFEKI